MTLDDWKKKAMQYAADNCYTWGSSGLQHEYMYVCAAIEECARVADSYAAPNYSGSTPEHIAAAIRALKDKP